MKTNLYSVNVHLRTWMSLLIVISGFWATDLKAQTAVTTSESFDVVTFPPVTSGFGGGTWRLYRNSSGTTAWVQSASSATNPTASPHSGAGMAVYSQPGSSQNGSTLESPVVDWSLRGSNQPTISVWVYRYNTTLTLAGNMTIKVSQTQGLVGSTAPGTLVATIPQRLASSASASGNWTMITGNATESADGWYQYTFRMPVSGTGSFSGATNYIQFTVGENTGTRKSLIDDVSWVSYQIDCVTPNNPITGLNLTATSSSSIGGTFTAVSSSPIPTNYLVVRFNAGADTAGAQPVNGTIYTAGQTLVGSSATGTVVAALTHPTTSFSATGLTAGTSYDFYIYGYQTGCAQTAFYNRISPLLGTQSSASCIPNQATGLSFSSITFNSIAGNFTASSPAASGYLVFYVPNGTTVTPPSDGTTYSSGNISSLATGAVFLQSSASTSFSAISLSASTIYDFYVFAFNSGAGCTSPTYNGTVTVNSNEKSQTTNSCIPNQPTSTNLNLSNNSVNPYTAIDGSFTAASPNPTGYLVVRYPAGTSVSGNASNLPVNGTAYTSGQSIGVGTVVQTPGSNISIAASGLTQNTSYDFYVFSYNSGAGGCATPTYNTTVNAGSNQGTFTSRPCLPSSPFGFNWTSVGLANLAGNFSAPTPAPTGGYLIVRYLSGATPVTPQDGSSYNTSSTFFSPGGVVQSSTATSFSNTGLSTGTAYDYYIYSYNTGTGCTNPTYNVSSPLIASNSTTACGIGISGTKQTIPGTYASLTVALADIISKGINGNDTLELQSTYTGAGETFPITISSNVCFGPISNLVIVPAANANGLTITSSNSTATIKLDGADYITIDGRPGGIDQSLSLDDATSGAANLFANTNILKIANTSTSGNAIQMVNDASNNSIKYCNVTGVNSSNATGAGGVILIGVGITTGCDNNTINRCNVHDGASTPAICINGYGGAGAGTGIQNDNCTISNCNIYNFYLANNTDMGVVLDKNTNAWMVSGNSFFQTASRSHTGGDHYMLWIRPIEDATATGAGFQVLDNYFGGRDVKCGGGAYTITGSGGANLRTVLIGTSSASNSIPNSIQGNTIANISHSSTTSGGSTFNGIGIYQGNADIGTLNGNIVGSSTVDASSSPSIDITGLSTTQGNSTRFAYGIGIQAEGKLSTFSNFTINIRNNTVAGIRTKNTSTGVGLGFLGIGVSHGGGFSTTSGNTLKIVQNQVGSTTQSNNIIIANNGNAGGCASVLLGIATTSNGFTATIDSNTVANLTMNLSPSSADGTSTIGTQADGIFAGIGLSATTGAISGTATTSSIPFVRGNNIYNITSASNTTQATHRMALGGIVINSSAATASVISGNTIHSLSSTAPSAAANSAGIYFTGATSVTHTFSKNLVHTIGVANTNAAMHGIMINAGVTNITNNMVRLGINAAGVDITTAAAINGINLVPTSVTNIYYNTVYIGGLGVGTTASNTAAFKRTATSASHDIRENIFVNARSNASTGGKHYALLLAGATGTFNYNLYNYTGTGGVFASTGSDVGTYTVGWVASDQNSITGNPQFKVPNGTASTVDIHINDSPLSAAANAGGAPTLNLSIIDDYDGQTRANNPQTMGADVLPCVRPNSYTPVITYISCNGANDGIVTINANGGIGPYDFVWSNGTTTTAVPDGIPTSISGLSPGTYSVVITAPGGCTVSTSAVVTQPAVFSVGCNGTAITCNGELNGTVSVNATGGGAGYTYLWNNGETTVSQTGLSAGTYSVTVTNSCGTLDCSYEVIEPAILSASCNGTSVTCFGFNNGTVSVTPSGGTTPYTYAWSNGVTTSSITGLAPNTYTVLVTDHGGCTATCSKEITEPAILNVTCDGTDVPCRGTNTGTASVIPTGGTTPYSYLWNNGATTQTASSLFAGIHSVTVTDANGCISSCAHFIDEPATVLSVSCAGTNNICFGETNGTASVIPSGGTTPYTYSWSNGSTENSLTGLLAGTYTGTVTDQNGCSVSCSYEVTQPPLLTVLAGYLAPACDGSNLYLTSTVGGGTGPFTYVWSGPNGTLNPVANPTITNATNANDVGNYLVTVTDQNGCIAGPSSVEVDVHTTPSGALFANTNADFESTFCYGDGGTLMILCGGSGTITGTLWDGASTTLASYSGTATQINIPVTSPVGTTIYYLQSMYDQYCAAKTVDIIGVDPITVHVNPSPTATITPSGPTTFCSGGSVTLDAGAGFTYLWSNGATTQTVNATTSGTYSVTVTNGSNCSATSAVTTVTVNTCNTTALNLKLYIQGYYASGGFMYPVLLNQTIGASNTETDTILVELRDEFTTSTVVISAKGLLMTDGTVRSINGVSNFEFTGAYTGTYWIAVKHRNALETWSGSTVSFATTPTYDFSSAANKALYDNQALVDGGLGLYGFYSGDIIPDGFIGIDDVNLTNNDNLAGLFFTYLATDINGDGFVGIDDVNIVNNNNLAGVFFLP